MLELIVVSGLATYVCWESNSKRRLRSAITSAEEIYFKGQKDREYLTNFSNILSNVKYLAPSARIKRNLYLRILETIVNLNELRGHMIRDAAEKGPDYKFTDDDRACLVQRIDKAFDV
jgi:hypothetical protein